MLTKQVLIATIYLLAAKGGLLLAFAGTNATPIWPATGIGLAAVLLLGYRIWPAIFFGSFLVNLSAFSDLGVSIPLSAVGSFFTAGGNTLESLLGAFLILRFTAWPNQFHLHRDTFRFILCGAIVPAVVSASIGTTVEAVVIGNWDNYGAIWLTWWLGDSAGVLVVTPLILTFKQRMRQWPWKKAVEASVILGLILALGWLVFQQGLHIQYMLLFMLIWVVFRFGHFESSVTIVLISGMAIMGSLQGIGPFVRQSLNESILLLQGYVSSASVAVMVFCSLIAERNLSEGQMSRSEQKTATLNRIANVFLTVPDEEMYGQVLEIVLDATGSRFGLFGRIAENGDLVIPSMTREIWSECQVAGKAIVFPPAAWGESLWGMAIRERRAFSSAGPFHTPAGHIPIDNFLTVPIVFGNGCIGLISVANRKQNYNAEDTELLESIASFIAPILSARLQRDQQEEALLRERSLLRCIIDSASDLIFIKDCNSIYLGCNKASEKLIGLPESEQIGKSDFDFFGQEKAKLIREADQHVFAEGNPFRVEEWVSYPDGGRVLLDTMKIPFYGPEGELHGLVGISRDITELKRAEELLRKREQEFRSLAENSPDNIARYDTDCRIFYVNPALRRSVNIDFDARMGKTPLETPLDGHVKFRNYEKYEYMLRSVLESGEPGEIEIDMPHPSGDFHTHQVLLVAERDEQGNVTGALTIGRDITERKRMEANISRLNEDLEQRVRARTAELESKNNELARLNRLFIGREIRMVELKGRIKELEDKING